MKLIGKKERGNPRSREGSGDKKRLGGQKNVPHSRRAPTRKLADRIVAFLEANAPLDFQPKFISLKLRASHGAVKKAIQREMINPKSNIVRVRPGWYRIAYTVDHLRALKGEKRVGLHGLHLSAKCPSDPTRLYLVKNAPFQYKNHGIYSLSFNGRPVTIEVYRTSPTVSVWLKASKTPLTLAEFDQFCYFLYGWSSSRIPDNAWIVKQYGFNLDMFNLDMTKSGYKSLTLSKFRNMWVQMYQKEVDMTRLELHGTSQDLTAQDLMRVVRTFISIVEGKPETAPGYESPPDDKSDISYR